MSYDREAHLAQIRAEELSQVELPFIILLVIVAVVIATLMLNRKHEDKNLFENLWEGDLGLALLGIWRAGRYCLDCRNCCPQSSP